MLWRSSQKRSLSLCTRTAYTLLIFVHENQLWEDDASPATAAWSRGIQRLKSTLIICQQLRRIINYIIEIKRICHHFCLSQIKKAFKRDTTGNLSGSSKVCFPCLSLKPGSQTRPFDPLLSCQRFFSTKYDLKTLRPYNNVIGKFKCKKVVM